MIGIGTIALAAAECAKNFPSDKEISIRIHAYAKYNGKWGRLGIDILPTHKYGGFWL